MPESEGPPYTSTYFICGNSEHTASLHCPTHSLGLTSSLADGFVLAVPGLACPRNTP